MDSERFRPDTLPKGDIRELLVYEGSGDLIEQVYQELHFVVSRVEKVARGQNNGIIILENTQGERLLTKFYQRDDRSRLDREFRANRFLFSHHFDVAQCRLRNDEYQYGVYSFEEGEHVVAEKATVQDIDHLADFLVRLQSFSPDTVSEPFPAAVTAMVNLQDVIGDNERRAQAVRSAIQEGGSHPLVVEMLKHKTYLDDVVKMTDRVIRANAVPFWRVEKNSQRLSPVDFGFHNALFRGEKPPCILDLEYFGWDDPLHPVADFLCHDKTLGLSESLRSRFLVDYCDGKKLSKEEQGRLSSLAILIDIKWILIYLQSLTPRYLDARSFAAAGNFDPEAYIRQQVMKVEQRKNGLMNSLED